MRAVRAISMDRVAADERDGARARFVADVEIAAARANEDMARLVARAFAVDAVDSDWGRLHRAVARLLERDARRVGPAYDRLRRFVAENDDLP